MSAECVINLATGHYIKGQERLKNSLNGFPFHGFTSELSIGSPLHSANPYAFKIYAFDKALEMGYTKILWLDASVWAIKPLDSIFKIIKEDGYVMQEAGHWCGTWCNDRCLDYFGIPRDEAMTMPMIGNAGFLGLNFDFPVAVEFFIRWKQAMLDGIFKGAWTNANNSESSDNWCRGHRHDMSCSSIIANQMGLKRQNGQNYLNYGTTPLNDTVCLLAQGM